VRSWRQSGGVFWKNTGKVVEMNRFPPPLGFFPANSLVQLYLSRTTVSENLRGIRANVYCLIQFGVSLNLRED
jgi:hypothetical protein